MFDFRTSIAAKLLIGYGLLGLLSILVVSAIYYVGTIGVLERNIDSKIIAASDRMIRRYEPSAEAALALEVRRQLSDGIDSDREIYLLMDADNRRLAGNLLPWVQPDVEDWPEDPGVLMSREVVRDGRNTGARLLLRRLPGGSTLVVGRDLSELRAIQELVWGSLGAGAAVSLILTLGGALLFRSQIERRIGDIRHTAAQIEAGDLSRRIPINGTDEFGLLNRDINRMLDRIEQLMEGIRHVSNAIAHDLRTPLGRIRGRLDDALRHDMTVPLLSDAAQGAIGEIDDLIRLFEQLLRIAEAESGMRSKLTDPVDLNRIAADMVDMYEATAEDLQLDLGMVCVPHAVAQGDRNLLASAVASLIDNAIKYAGAGATVRVCTGSDARGMSIAVIDNGPGIPAGERDKVLQRFYRLDQSRSLPGNGLGLSIVKATATLHGGTLELGDAGPGLAVRIILPSATAG